MTLCTIHDKVAVSKRAYKHAFSILSDKSVEPFIAFSFVCPNTHFVRKSVHVYVRLRHRVPGINGEMLIEIFCYIFCCGIGSGEREPE